MKITLVAVISANGKITKGDDPNIYKWTSDEDRNFFTKLVTKNKLIIMGSGTYDVAKSQFKHDKKRLRVVLTGNPNKYKNDEIKGLLEFYSGNPKVLVRRLSKKFNQALVVGGSEINYLFLKEKLVDKIYLTVEPVLFGQGKNVVADLPLKADLKLISVKKLNTKGTLLLKYKVVK